MRVLTMIQWPTSLRPAPSEGGSLRFLFCLDKYSRLLYSVPTAYA